MAVKDDTSARLKAYLIQLKNKFKKQDFDVTLEKASPGDGGMDGGMDGALQVSLTVSLSMEFQVSLSMEFQEMFNFGVESMNHEVLDYKLLAGVLIISLLSQQQEELSEKKLFKFLIHENECLSNNIMFWNQFNELANQSLQNRLVLLIALLGTCSEGANLEEAFDYLVQITSSHSESIIQRLGTIGLLRWFHRVVEGEHRLMNQAMRETAFDFITERWQDTLIPQSMLKELFTLLLDSFRTEYPSLLIDRINKFPPCRIKMEMYRFVCSKIPVSRFMSENPQFLNEAFSTLDKLSLNSSSVECINNAAKGLAKEKKCLDKVFGDFILTALTSSNNTVSTLTSERILPCISALQPEILNSLTKKLLEFHHGPNKQVALISIFVSAKFISFSLEIYGTNQYYETIQNSIQSMNPALRMSALNLATYSKKTSKDVEGIELNMVKLFLTSNYGGESAPERQNIKAVISKLLERIKRAMYGNARDIKSLTLKASKLPIDSEKRTILQEDIKIIEEKYTLKKEFMAWFHSFSMSGLHPGASLIRALSSMDFLLLNLKAINLSIDQVADKGSNDWYPTFYSLKDSEILLSYLMVSYNKGPVLDFIQSNTHLIFDTSPQEYHRLLELSLKKLSSSRALDLESGAALTKYLIIVFFTRMGIIELVGGLLEWYLETWRCHLKECEKSISIGSKTSPLNGVVLAVRNIVQQVPECESSKPEWRKRLVEITLLCKQSIDATHSIVSDPTPEMGVLSEKDIDPQIISRHCYRTIKEATAGLLAIAQIHLKCPQNDSKPFIIELGNLYSKLLVTVRHKGAYVSTEESFALYCLALGLKSDNIENVELLKTWLKEFLDRILSLEISVTRRSGGLPPSILAILVAIKDQKTKSEMLQKTLDTCFEIMQTSDVVRNERIDLAQVHAMNVLRLVMCDSELSKLTRNYIGTCFTLCLEQFSSPYFPIRNCAAMIFSTLVSKAFGTTKCKAEGVQVNHLFAKEFFLRFPGLYSTLLERLQKAVDLLRKQEFDSVLYPILSILSRIKTSDTFTMDPFRSLILKCGGSGLWKVREVASRTICGLVQHYEIIDAITLCVDQFSPDASPNLVHGIILQISELHQFRDGIPPSKRSAFASQLLRLNDVWTVQKYSTARGVLLKIVNDVYLSASDFDIDVEEEPCRLLCSSAIKCSFEMLRGSISTAFCPSYNIETASFITFSNTLFFNENDLKGLIQVQDTTSMVSILRAVNTTNFNEYPKALKKHILLTCSDIFNRKDFCPHLVEASCKILMMADNLLPFDAQVEFWVRKGGIPFVFLETLMRFASCILPFKPSVWRYIYEKAVECLDTTFPVSLRFAIATCLKTVSTEIVEKPYFFQYSILLCKILQDDDDDVRNLAVEIAGYIMNSTVLKTPRITFQEFSSFVTKKAAIQENCVDWIEFHVSILTHSNLDVLESISVRLFDDEEPNSFRENLESLATSASCLSLVFASCEPEIVQPWMERLEMHLDRSILIFERIDLRCYAINLAVFNLVSEGVCCALVSRKGIQRLKKLALHPVLMELLD